TGLAVRGLVPVDDALGDGLVELARSGLQRLVRHVGIAGRDSGLHLAGVGLELGLDGAVAQTSLLVRLVALDLGLDVCHEDSSPVLLRWIIPDCRGTEPTGTAVGIRLETSVPESLPRVLARVARTARPLRHFGRTPLRTPNGMSHIQGAILTEGSPRTGAHVRRVSRSAMRAPPAPRRPHRPRTRRAEPARPPA